MHLYSFLTIVVVAAIAVYGLYLTIGSVASTIFDKQKWEIRYKNTEIILPLRLQAYERMCLFLERMAPNNLILRVSDSFVGSAIEFQQLLLQEIRHEYNHNLAQQVYLSHEAWEEIKKAMNEVVALINQSASEVPHDATANDLARKVFENVIQQPQQSVNIALKFIKDEIQAVF
jgi:uncharacterized protein HemY